VAKETGQKAATVVAENISKMYSRMPAGLRSNAIWIANQDVEPSLDTMSVPVGTGGTAIYMPAGGISDAPYGRLKGRPVIFIEQCETLGTEGDIMFVNMMPYLWATKGRIMAASSIHLKFDYNQTAFRWTLRVDGQPRFKSPLTPFKGTGTLSPFVKLATRS
jgi:HK97 family phage major capsid protein